MGAYTHPLTKVSKMEGFLASEETPCPVVWRKNDRAKFIEKVLRAVGYDLLPRNQKGVVRQYLQITTGYSRAQVARAIKEHRKRMKEVCPELPVRKPSPFLHASVSALACILLLLSSSTLVPKKDSLKFLTGERADVIDVLGDMGDLFPEGTQTISRVSTVESVVRTKDGKMQTAPLYTKKLELQQYGYHRLKVQATLASTPEKLQDRVDQRRDMRINLLWDRIIAGGQAGGIHTSAPIQAMEGETASGVVDETWVVAAGQSDIWSLIGVGEEGEILIVQDGRPKWSRLPPRKGNPELGPGRSPYPYGAEGDERRRYGGGGGGSDTTTTTTSTTTIITQTTERTGAFVGLTTSSDYNGEITYSSKVGYDAANTICAAEYSSSHFCRTDEIIYTIASGDYETLFSGVNAAWIAEGPPGYIANSNDCRGWTSSGSTNLGAWWEFNTTGGGIGFLTNCSTTKPIACCR